MPPKKVTFLTKKGKSAPKGKANKKKVKAAKKAKPPKAAKKAKPPKAAKKAKPPKKSPTQAQDKVDAAAATNLTPKVDVESTHNRKSESALDKTLFTKRDYIVIALLWGYEVLFVITEAGKALFLQKQNDRDARTLTVDTVPKSFSSLVLVVFTIFWMMTVAVKTSGRARILALFIGLIIYLATPICGLLATKLLTRGFSETMIWLQNGWHAVNPVRFWLIFNQRFPLPASSSRIVVTANVFVIGIVKYSTSVFPIFMYFLEKTFSIPATFHFPAYAIFWSVTAVVMLTWLYFIFWFRVFFNEIEDDIDVIAEKYKDAEVEECFRARQTQRHIVIFSLLLCPSIMFSILESAVVQLIHNQRDESFFFAKYRLDMIIGLISLLVFYGLLITIGRVRHEIKDLMVITLAHLLNLLVFALLFFEMIHIKPLVVPEPKPVLHGHSFLYPDSADDGAVIMSNYKECAGEGSYKECWSEAGKKAKLQGFRKDGFSMFSFEDDFKSAITPWILHFGVLHPVRNRGIVPPANESERIAWAVSCLEPCKDVRPSRDEFGHTWYFSADGDCRRLGLIVSFRDSLNGSDIVEPTLLDVPLITEGVTKSINYPGGIVRKVVYVFDGQEQSPIYEISDYRAPPAHLEFVVWIESSNGSLAMDIRNKNPSFLLDWPYEPIGPTTTTTPPPMSPPMLKISRPVLTAALAISGVPVGIATASYIHFIWIQSPWYDKTITLAGYFGINYFGSWYVRNYITGLYDVDYQTLLIFQMISLVWHVLTVIYFNSNLRELTPKEKSQGNLMLF